MRVGVRMAWGVALALAAALWCGAVAQEARPAATPGLVALIKSDAESRGRVAPGTMVRRTGVLRNAASERVEIRVARTTCSCVQHSLSSASLNPGEEATVSLWLTSIEATEPQRHAVFVEAMTRDAAGVPTRRETLPLWIEYEPDVEAIFTPSEWIGRVLVRGEDGAVRVWIRRGDGKEPELDGVDVPEWLRVKSFEVVREPSVVGVLSLVPATNVPGVYRGPVRIRLRGQAGPGHQVFVNLRLEPEWRPIPAGVAWTIPKDDPSARTWTIRLWATSPKVEPPEVGEVRPAEARAGIVVGPVRASAAKGARSEFDVTIDPAALKLAEDGHATTAIEVRGKDGAVLLSVPVVCFGPRALSGGAK